MKRGGESYPLRSGGAERSRHSFRPAFALLLILAVLLSASAPRQILTLALVGDLMLGRGISPTFRSFSYLASELSRADLALANLESPFSLPGGQEPASPNLPGKAYNLCASSEYAGLLPRWGFDLLSISNNHQEDCNAGGITQTTIVLDEVGITAIPTNQVPVILRVNGLSLAFLAFDDVTYALDEAEALQAIHSAKDGGALVIVSVHWGAEYQGGASSRQKSLAQSFAQAGAALIWGHHPHVLQPAEWLVTPACQGEAPGRACTLVLYSLGNALFDQGGLQGTRQSALVLLQVGRQGVISARSLPFLIDPIQSRVLAADTPTAESIRSQLNLP